MVEAGRTLTWLEREIDARGALYLVLLDPDMFEPPETARLAGLAVEAGAAAATQVGESVSSHIIPRPSDGLVEAYLS